METPSTPLGWLYGLLLVIGGLGLSALMGWGAVLLAAKAKESKLAALASELYELAQSIVAHVEAELRPKASRMLLDGKLSKEEAAELKADAMKLFMQALDEHGLKRLERLRGLVGPSAEVYLSGLLERALGVQRVLATPAVKRVQLRAGDVLATTVVPANPPSAR